MTPLQKGQKPSFCDVLSLSKGRRLTPVEPGRFRKKLGFFTGLRLFDTDGCFGFQICNYNVFASDHCLQFDQLGNRLKSEHHKGDNNHRFDRHAGQPIGVWRLLPLDPRGDDRIDRHPYTEEAVGEKKEQMAPKIEQSLATFTPIDVDEVHPDIDAILQSL